MVHVKWPRWAKYNLDSIKTRAHESMLMWLIDFNQQAKFYCRKLPLFNLSYFTLGTSLYN